MKRIMTSLGGLMAWATPALAATNGREDNSDLLVWIFLSFCALIVIAQLVPAMMVILGMVKGIKKRAEKGAPQVG